MKILVVDDDIDFADGMAEMLELFGHDTRVAYSCDTGIAVAQVEKFDVAMIDVGLADRFGTECANGLKRFNDATRCVLMTGYSADALAQMGVPVNDYEILRKPIRPEDLAPYLTD